MIQAITSLRGGKPEFKTVLQKKKIFEVASQPVREVLPLT